MLPLNEKRGRMLVQHAYLMPIRFRSRQDIRRGVDSLAVIVANVHHKLPREYNRGLTFVEN